MLALEGKDVRELGDIILGVTKVVPNGLTVVDNELTEIEAYIHENVHKEPLKVNDAIRATDFSYDDACNRLDIEGYHMVNS